MSTTTENNGGDDAGLLMAPRVAYTFNNYQPVRSTIIGEQPLFYLDYEEESEDEFDELFGMEAIEQGLTSLEAQLNSFEKELGVLPDEAEELFETAAYNITTASAVEDASVTCDELTVFLRQSRLAATFIDFAAGHGVKLAAGTQVEKAFYDAKAQKIFLNMALPRDDLALLVAQELRRVWQDKNGALVSPLTLHPDQAVLVNRAQIADANAVMLRVAWELQLAGEKGPWARLLHSPLNDLARAFAREAHNDFRRLNNGTACAAAFESWFLSERCEKADKDLIQNMMGNHRGYVFGSSADSAVQAHQILLALGSMPYGKNYLSTYVSTIMDDALFTEVRDRSNANFLWFIKFENSFQEAEQELQKREDIDSTPFPGGASRNMQELAEKDHETHTRIIPLRHDPDNNASAVNGDVSGGNVVPFRARHS